MTMDDLTDDLMDEGIEACRTCGVYYLMNSNNLQKLFQSHVDYPEMKLVHSGLSLFTSEIHENDGFSQFICTGCILEFKRVSLFKSSIDAVQSQFREIFNIKQQNIKIKREVPETEETDYSTTFIYVDDLSDEEYDGKTPFLAPHQPIKEEIIEGAAMPIIENSNNFIRMTTTTTTTPPTPTTPTTKNIATSATSAIEENGLTSPLSTSILTMEREMDNLKQYKCNLCPHLAKSELMLQQHAQRFHNKKDHSCHICGKVIENFSPNRLRFHMKWHKINKYKKCPQCGFHCESKETLQEHKLAVHSKVKCDFCHKLVLVTSLTAHKRLHNNQVEWPCFFCNNVFNTEEARDDHIMETHNDEDRIYELDDDTQSHQSLPIFETNDIKQENATTTIAAADIKQENGINYNITSFNYDIDYNSNDDDNNSDIIFTPTNNTSRTSSNNDSMTTDSATETETETNLEEINRLNGSYEITEEVIMKKFQCAKCKQIFDNINILVEHAKIHTFSRDKQFPCEVCGESFDLKFRLNRHLKKHKE